MPSREIFWNISYAYIIYILAVIALAILSYSIYRRYKLWRVGKPDNRSKEMGKRIKTFIRTTIIDILIHRRFLREPYPGIMHLFIFWGFVIMLFGAAVDAVTHYTGLELVGSAYLWFSLILDTAGVMVLIGIIMAAYRRYIQKPERLNTILDDGVVMSLLTLIIITGYAIEGLRQAATELTIHPDWAIWSPLGWIFAQAFSGMGMGLLLFWHKFLWWFHVIIFIGTIVYVALRFSKLQHIIISPLNVFFRNLGPVGTPAPIDIESVDTLGVGDSREFTWKQLLDLDACTNCGRCQDACPAWLSKKPLSPRKLTQDIKNHWLQTAQKPSDVSSGMPTLVGDTISEEEIWACTTCGACQEICPVYLEHMVKIIDLRRNLVLARNRMPESAQVMLRNMQARGHPWAGIQSLRLRGDWTSGLELNIMGHDSDVHILFWVGCTGALVERNVKTTLSLVKVLTEAGVNFGVLGETENCCGDPARRAGYEFQFQMMAEQNIEVFKGYNVKEIVTACPHCYNAFKNEYPYYGGDFKVVHYTQLLSDLVQQGRLKLTKEIDSVFTYHDPCYLGRYNREYSAPRDVLQAFPGIKLREMQRSRNSSFCCGGGGGHTWIEELPGIRINEIRLGDVLQTGADTVVTACPYCLQMIEEAIEHKEIKDSLKARDLVELVEDVME